MELIRSRDWYTTADGADRGYIRPHLLKELWFHTGTACNLSCDFCLEGSSPGDKRLELVKLEDVTPYIDQAVELGVEQFSFTGGEPFLAKDLVKILQQAAQHVPCLVLTNGTDAVQKRLHQLVPLLKSRYPVSFRISIDSHIEAEHDAGRGEGMFDLALKGMKALYDMGFQVSLARHMADGEDTAAVEHQYRAILENYGIPSDTKFVAFPDFLPPGSHGHGPDITTNCMTQFHTEETRNSFMCSFSKMVVKQRGQMRVYACTLVDDDPEYDMGSDLRASLEQQVSMKHHRCFSCFKYGASCSET
ncbi:radical SAM protein [Amphritea sp. 1_MG-2023]|uniref:radical SAM protein n=1 Tax=Amphritea sp. 1_MG-2023 TaxID=3062670 RepID=UPI0026E2FEE6|nr:radical SAM protein [Amphritea sp. 1_MG-2023]MDO6563442.1 radical SAM protein [Amphritea sp. 1_MG-2023]